MKIEQLTIENFKCFKTEKTFDFPRLTILTGANSSGKSSVIQAILAALQTDNFPSNYSLNGDFVNLGDFTEVSNNNDPNNIIQIGFKFKGSDIHEIQTFWKENKKDGLAKRTSFDKQGNVEEEKEGFYFEYVSSEFLVFINQVVSYVNYISAFRQSPQRTYLEKNKGDYRVGTEGEGYLDQIVEWEKRGNGKIKTLVEKMKGMELIKDIKINRLGGGRFEVLVKANKNKGFAALSDVGSGISAFMPIMVADLQLSNDATLFLAEPENHLHPSVQSKFGDYIVNQVNETQKNYIIETHSEYFLNKIRLAIVKGELKKEDIKIYFLENKDDDTEVFDIDFKKNGAIKNAPKTFFETYSIDVMDIALNAFAE